MKEQILEIIQLNLTPEEANEIWNKISYAGFKENPEGLKEWIFHILGITSQYHLFEQDDPRRKPSIAETVVKFCIDKPEAVQALGNGILKGIRKLL